MLRHISSNNNRQSEVATSLIASIKNNRRAMGSEKEPVYVEIGIDRIHKFIRGELKIRPLGTEVYKPTGKEKVVQIPQEWLK